MDSLNPDITCSSELESVVENDENLLPPSSSSPALSWEYSTSSRLGSGNGSSYGSTSSWDSSDWSSQNSRAHSMSSYNPDFAHHLHKLLLLLVDEQENQLDICSDYLACSTPNSVDPQKQDIHADNFTSESSFQSSNVSGTHSPTSKKSIRPSTNVLKSSPTPPVIPSGTSLYRMIHRPQSYMQGRTSSQISQDNKYSTELTQPVSKRARTTANLSAHALDRVYARKPATLRKAASLRSTYTPRGVSEVPPTVPVTPSTDFNHPSLRKQPHNLDNTLRFCVPIIAPPEDHIPRFPLTSERLAKIRLKNYLDQERSNRAQELLAPEGIKQPEKTIFEHSSQYYNSADVSRPSKVATPISYKSELWDKKLNMKKDDRQRILRWILQAIPAPSGSSSSDISADSSLSNVLSQPDSYTPDLLNELTTSPDTRFHAAWMFLRYFYVLMSDTAEICSGDTGAIDDHSFSTTQASYDGHRLLIWDIAVSCLALSVKFHRDVLEPLKPVLAREYISLCPHTMSYEDLEASQRDVLSVFSYRLGVTPQPIIENLWGALPSLRELLSFEGGWNQTLKYTWRTLFIAISGPCVLYFPVALLTATALIDSVLLTLTCHREYCTPWYRDHVQRKDVNKNLNLYCIHEGMSYAKETAEGVIQDIQAIMEIPDDDLIRCRNWIRSLKQPHSE